ncbi:MAG TPA: CRTAC1 family protein, partial [Bryobacteraceae bacterium]|nr:CRTAC1 family protein [Bryobacteraceae bacterium]
LEGWLDIFAANGHIDEEIGRVQPKVAFRQPSLLFRNNGRGGFENVSSSAGSAMQTPMVARGAAWADYDRDGDLDVLVSENHGPARLFRNDGGNANQWIQVKLEGKGTNRSAIGSTVKVGGQWRTVQTGSSYCSQSDLALTFGLGRESRPVTVDVVWPGGASSRFAGLTPGKRYVISEGAGVRQAP